jgi:DNA polymerase-3 subunit epsilon
MLLLGLDFETTGLSFTDDRITEIGAVLWDTDARMPVQIFNTLVKHPDCPPITDEITRLTGITQAMLDYYGVAPAPAFRRLGMMLAQAGVAVAHNGNGFDRPMLEAQMLRFSAVPETATIVSALAATPLLWVDTCMDVPYPPAITTRKLVHLAAEHGFLNPFAHRAVFDVLTMLKVLDGYIATPDALESVLESARQPTVTMQALVSFDDREKAKARGYRWKSDTKQWLRHMKAHQAEAERAECGFKTEIISSTSNG